ncbi:hypothetical protein BJY52DRAFT_1420483 [Lactarius psammicola]|nr:hypothetical protein BJY52DRAFT_1420483 [Lactarius psammicola]
MILGEDKKLKTGDHGNMLKKIRAKYEPITVESVLTIHGLVTRQYDSSLSGRLPSRLSFVHIHVCIGGRRRLSEKPGHEAVYIVCLVTSFLVPTLTFATSAMSQTPTTASASSRFQAIFNAALKSYEKQTKNDLIAHPLASQLQSCDSTSAILAVLQDQVREFDQARSGDERLTNWLNPTVNVLCAFSVALGEGFGLVFSPAKVAAKDVAASKDALADLFTRMGFFFKRLETYTEVTPTSAMTDIITEIMVEVLTIFGIATKELRRGSASEFPISCL